MYGTGTSQYGFIGICLPQDAGSSSESPKLNRAETELRKCLGNDVDAGLLLKSESLNLLDPPNY